VKRQLGQRHRDIILKPSINTAAESVGLERHISRITIASIGYRVQIFSKIMGACESAISVKVIAPFITSSNGLQQN